MKALMDAHGLSLNAVAKAMPIDRKRVTAWMNGKPAQIGSIVRLAEVLETRTQELIEGAQPVTTTLTASFTVQNAEEMRLLANLLAEVQMKLESHREQKALEAQITVYYLETFETSTQRECYFYMVCMSVLNEKMLNCLVANEYPDFALIVAKGYGKPTQEVKAKIREYYGFDHDIDENPNPIFFNKD